jgi:hypothetical protein
LGGEKAMGIWVDPWVIIILDKEHWRNETEMTADYLHQITPTVWKGLGVMVYMTWSNKINRLVFIFVDISGILFAYQCYTLLCYQNPTMS